MDNLFYRIKKTLVKIDLATNLAITYVDVSKLWVAFPYCFFTLISLIVCYFIQCYEFDKFEGFATEEEAVKRGLSLIDTGGLWAVIVFLDNESNFTTKELPHNIAYKLRYVFLTLN